MQQHLFQPFPTQSSMLLLILLRLLMTALPRPLLLLVVPRLQLLVAPLLLNHMLLLLLTALLLLLKPLTTPLLRSNRFWRCRRHHLQTLLPLKHTRLVCIQLTATATGVLGMLVTLEALHPLLVHMQVLLLLPQVLNITCSCCWCWCYC
jgi:hypothetical protein